MKNTYRYIQTCNTFKHTKRQKSIFGAAQIKKTYVSFHLMPVYYYPELLDEISDELKSKMQGKSCFNFKEIDKSQLSELKSLTKSAFEKYKEMGRV
ncbi:MAG: hypothetical protein IPI23_07400 [Bacteroidetes bacterium]|nr:hypothetical protein [Bacteroidota bacterium]